MEIYDGLSIGQIRDVLTLCRVAGLRGREAEKCLSGVIKPAVRLA